MHEETALIVHTNSVMLHRRIRKVLNEENESRLQHRFAVAVQDLLCL